MNNINFRLFFLTLLLATNTLANPNIVVSIKPIHSIVSSLTQGVSTPKLLLSGRESAHHAHLKPSQLSLLEQADLVVIVHPEFEEGLSKSIGNIPVEKIFTVDQVEVGKHDEHDEHDEHDKNHHSWLSIQRMQQFSQKLGERLMQIDPKNTAIYNKNLTNLKQKLVNLQSASQQQLSSHTNQPLITYNNAFKHFIAGHQLVQVESVSQQHGENLSIFKILKAKQRIQKHQISCLLFTTEIPQKRINTLTEGLSINTADIDIIGFDIQPGADHYFKLMQNIAQKTSQCLK